MSNYLEALNLPLSAQSDAGKRRKQILQSTPWAPVPTTHVSYVSANRLLIIAGLETARQIEARLPEKLLCYIACPADKSGPATPANGYYCSGLAVSGYLGRFAVFIDEHPGADTATDANNNLASIFNIHSELFDQVLDCSSRPFITAAIKPPGYHHVGQDESLMEIAVENIPEMIGEFEKPKFFDYNPDICAHGRSGIRGCTRCLDACPADAIFSLGEMIEVNPHLCQGGGACASSCPTGAIGYAYPKADEQIEFLRVVLKSLREKNQNHGVTLLIFDNEHGREVLESFAGQLAEYVIPYVVEEIGSVGLDLLASALAYGANRVYLYVPDTLSPQVTATLERNLSIIAAVLEQTHCDTHQIKIIGNLRALSTDDEPKRVEHAAIFAPMGDKRAVIRAALGFFSEMPQCPVEAVQLPDGALFGQIHLDADACTLCMGCVSVCPASALQAGGESPALGFIEANCVQCGICTRACPESAVTLEPRLHFDYNIINKVRTLKEETPFLCVDCGKPFATKAMISKMTEKLRGHWMFDKPEALNRLRMCEDCRIKDMFDKNDMIA